MNHEWDLPNQGHKLGPASTYLVFKRYNDHERITDFCQTLLILKLDEDLWPNQDEVSEN